MFCCELLSLREVDHRDVCLLSNIMGPGGRCRLKHQKIQLKNSTAMEQCRGESEFLQSLRTCCQIIKSYTLTKVLGNIFGQERVHFWKELIIKVKMFATASHFKFHAGNLAMLSFYFLIHHHTFLYQHLCQDCSSACLCS